jgi:heme exporter protein D
MLFKFNFFWKCLLSLIVGWAFYLLVGYELTVITMLSLIIASNTKDTNFLI